MTAEAPVKVPTNAHNRGEAASSCADVNAMVVNVIGDAAVPCAMIFAPRSSTSDGATPLPSSGVALMVVPASIVSVTPAFTKVGHVMT